MPLDGLFTIARWGIVAVDYHLVYRIHAVAHAQLYAGGLIERVRWFVPSAQATEYCPGVVHIPVDAYNRYLELLQACISSPDQNELRSSTTARMRRSIAELARANWRFEHHWSPSSLHELLAAAKRAMAFYNFNDETGLPGRLLNRLGDLVGSLCLQQVLTPVVTPYMLLLAARAGAAATQPTKTYLDRFRNGAVFLREFDPPELVEPDHTSLIHLAGQYRANTAPETPPARRRRRRTAFQELVQATAGWPDADHTLFIELVTLACAAADHEEARHYWQARTMRNLRRVCAATGLDLRAATLLEIAQAGEWSCADPPR